MSSQPQRFRRQKFCRFTKEGVKEIMNITDAVFISFKNVPVLSTGSPNKFFDGLAAGKIAIINFEGWLKELIDKKQCGIYYDTKHPESFINSLQPFLERDEYLKIFQANARDLAKNYSLTNQLKVLDEIIR